MNAANNDCAIRVEGLSKKLARTLREATRYAIVDISRDLLGLRAAADSLRHKEFWAVQDVSFQLRRGECLGVIGPNGAGKSTLLRMLNGVILPDTGRIEMRGRVGALIHVGSGFHPLLTGRENVYAYGAILGMSGREIRARIDAILDFAELEGSIDMPVKFYSSGMYVRLGFAILAHLNPDILLIDEALAVGDLPFRIKCLNHLKGLIKSGVTVVLVSHDLYQVQAICSRVIMLEKGRMAVDGGPDDVVGAYEERYGFRHISLVAADDNPAFEFLSSSVRVGDQEAGRRGDLHEAETNKPLRLIIRYRIKNGVPEGVLLSLAIKTSEGTRIYGFTTMYEGQPLPGEPGDYGVCLEFERNLLTQGNYYIGLAAYDSLHQKQLSVWEPAIKMRVITPGYNSVHTAGPIAMPHRVYLVD